MLEEPRVVFRGGPDARGFVKHAYQTAATLTGYAITVDPKTRRWTLTGAVVDQNPFLLAQAPLVFVVPTKAGVRRWPIVSLSVAGDRVLADLLES